jgi:hypothetical protein
MSLMPEKFDLDVHGGGICWIVLKLSLRAGWLDPSKLNNVCASIHAAEM